MIDEDAIVDRNGVLLKKGQTVRIHQEEEIRLALVHDTFEEDPVPTVNERGYWVDVDHSKTGKCLEGMMSYILEVVQ